MPNLNSSFYTGGDYNQLFFKDVKLLYNLLTYLLNFLFTHEFFAHENLNIFVSFLFNFYLKFHRLNLKNCCRVWL